MGLSDHSKSSEKHTNAVRLAYQMLTDEGYSEEEGVNKNYALIADHSEPISIALILISLNKLGLGAKVNRELIANHKAPLQITTAVYILNTVELLKDEDATAIFNAVAGHTDPEGVANVLVILKKVDLLTEANINLAANISFRPVNQASAAADILNMLIKANLLKGISAQDNFRAVATQEYPDYLYCALRALNDANLLTEDVGQANFTNLITYQNILLHTQEFVLNHKDTGHIWSRIPSNCLTKELFDAIIADCKQYAQNEETGRDKFIKRLNDQFPGIFVADPKSAIQDVEFNPHRNDKAPLGECRSAFFSDASEPKEPKEPEETDQKELSFVGLKP